MGNLMTCKHCRHWIARRQSQPDAARDEGWCQRFDASLSAYQSGEVRAYAASGLPGDHRYADGELGLLSMKPARDWAWLVTRSDFGCIEWAAE